MNDIGKPERSTQERILKLFRDELRFRYLGDWTDRGSNSNIEESLPGDCLEARPHDSCGA